MAHGQSKNKDGFFLFEAIILGLLLFALLVQIVHNFGINLPPQILVSSAWINLGLMLLFLGYEAVLPQRSFQYLEKYSMLSFGIIIYIILEISYLPDRYGWGDDLNFLLVMSVSVILFSVFWVRKIIPLEFFKHQEQDIRDWHLENMVVKSLYSSDLIGIILMAFNFWNGYLSFIGLKSWMWILVGFFVSHFLVRVIALISWVVDPNFQRNRLTIEDFIPFFTGTMITAFYPLKEVRYIAGLFSLLLIWVTILFLKVNSSFESDGSPERVLAMVILILVI